MFQKIGNGNGSGIGIGIEVTKARARKRMGIRMTGMILVWFRRQIRVTGVGRDVSGSGRHSRDS
jgi:hypothetical protein